jgi:Tfp pilus assembly protein PilF
MKAATQTRRLALACALLVVVTLAAYWPVFQCQFVNVDDPGYVQGNEHVLHGLSWEGVRWAFSTGFLGNWNPLTWLSHMLIVQWFGPDPMPHHIANLALHVINTLLLLAFLYRATGALGRSTAVAFLFALHPLHVESVAWVSERKDVLSGLFFFLTLLAYGSYVEESKVHSSESKVRGSKAKIFYGLALLAFGLGLMSKPMLVTVPFVLLILDVWPLGRIAPTAGGPTTLKRLILEKIPMVALAVVICVVTFSIQDRSGAMSSFSSFPLQLRAMNAIASYAKYLEKSAWPAHLAFFYPYPRSVPAGVFVVALVFLAGISYLAFKCRRQHPCLAVGWLWYLGMLLPVIGLVKVGSEAMADRYMYLPSVGLFVAFVWGVADALRGHASWCRAALAAGFLLVPVLAIRTYCDSLVWHDSGTLARHALEVTTDNAAAQICLGGSLFRQGKLDEAAGHFEEATRIAPGYSRVWLYFGQAQLKQGKPKPALESLRTAERLDPDDADTCLYLAQAYQLDGDTALAVRYYRRSNELEKDQSLVLDNLAWLLATAADPAVRNGTEAVQLAERACELTHYHKAICMGTLAAAYAEAGKFELAAAMAERARARALENGNKEVAARNEELLALYKAGRAYHEKP